MKETRSKKNKTALEQRELSPVGTCKVHDAPEVGCSCGGFWAVLAHHSLPMAVGEGREPETQRPESDLFLLC